MSNITTVYNFFKMKGLSNEAVCAIIGNLQQESGPSINPGMKQSGGGPGRGISQWETHPYGTRFLALEKLAASRNTSWDNLTTQLEFMWGEMNSKDISDRMKGKATNWNDNGAFLNSLNKKGAKPLPNGFEDFIKMTDIEQAVRIFDATYHRSGTPKMEQRIEYAKRAFEIYGQTPIEAAVTKEELACECSKYTIGSIVKLRPGATWMTDPPKSVPDWAMNALYRIDRLAGQRAILNTDGVNSPIDIKWLQLVE